ncbi:hypothetical protein BACUNI_03239 [Bacteroides uniformis ATCC 8492]|uniref:Uncharacterized protein n=1 Tax=Bacteroides uniformis (strain ATCC 8492 / DSM 6597 / CCUG 4942 / CIP 103695 / JCM 5828 / KCTC 5204 / NCTC 13054 / VPI 0061) TaxID=411479 RepID=A0ABC9N961_BACUC|nr:hypothetical protein BACUNI_03239 [Bacteroides uniformis ATCC 8492]
MLIFSVYFCGARCSYIYIYSCTLHQPHRAVLRLAPKIF